MITLNVRLGAHIPDPCCHGESSQPCHEKKSEPKTQDLPTFDEHEHKPTNQSKSAKDDESSESDLGNVNLSFYATFR